MENDQTFFTQEGIPQRERTLDDFFRIQGGTLHFLGIFQTANFIPGVRGVQIRNEGLDSSGGTINGATIGGTTLSVSNGGTGASSLTGILKGNGTGAVTTVAGVSGTFFVANGSGGSTTHQITVTNGVITAIA